MVVHLDEGGGREVLARLEVLDVGHTIHPDHLDGGVELLAGSDRCGVNDGVDDRTVVLLRLSNVRNLRERGDGGHGVLLRTRQDCFHRSIYYINIFFTNQYR